MTSSDRLRYGLTIVWVGITIGWIFLGFYSGHDAPFLVALISLMNAARIFKRARREPLAN